MASHEECGLDKENLEKQPHDNCDCGYAGASQRGVLDARIMHYSRSCAKATIKATLAHFAQQQKELHGVLGGSLAKGLRLRGYMCGPFSRNIMAGWFGTERSRAILDAHLPVLANRDLDTFIPI